MSSSPIHQNILKPEYRRAAVVRLVVSKTAAGQLYHHLIPLVLLLIVGSSPFDVVDPSWELYVLIQRKTDQQGEIYNRLLGFTAVYRFYHYPDSSRLRIGQILVLLPYQHKGYGQYLLEVLNDVAISENVYDLTVEEPLDYFQHSMQKMRKENCKGKKKFFQINKCENISDQFFKKLKLKPLVEAIAPQEQPQQQENEDFAALFQEIEPQQVAAPEQQLEQGSSSGINPCYQKSVQGLQEFGQFQETGVAAPEQQLEQGSSSGINPSYYPQSVQGLQEFEFAQLQKRGTQHAQEVIAAQGMPEQQQELEQSWSLQVSPQFHEPAAQEHAVMAAQDMPLPQQPQQVEQGGHAPPDVPPSHQNKITRCSKRFEKQLAYSE
ncbi:unnamed protein product [Prunus armeniaca]